MNTQRVGIFALTLGAVFVGFAMFELASRYHTRGGLETTGDRVPSAHALADPLVHSTPFPTVTDPDIVASSQSGTTPAPFSSYPYSLEFLASLDEATRRLALEQQARDADRSVSTPRLGAMNEFVEFPNGTLVELRIGVLIARGYGSIIYGVRNHQDLVIKYEANCGGRVGIHPILRDFWFLERAHGLASAPNAIFVSPPAKLGTAITPKTQFMMDAHSRSLCASRDDSFVRYMVMERITTTILDIMDSPTHRTPKITLDFAIVVLRRTIYKLQQLHEAGIVHNDVHPGNVVIMGTEAEARIGFIDFGLSFFAAQFSGLPQKVPHIREARTFCADSVFALDGYRPSYRDDLFGAMLMGAFLANGMELLLHCTGMDGKRAEMELFKRYSFFFAHGPGPDVIDMLEGRSDATKAEIRYRLQTALAIVRAIDDVDALPPHRAILDQLDPITDLIRGVDCDTTDEPMVVSKPTSPFHGGDSTSDVHQVTVGDSTSS